MADLEANFMHLQLLNESLGRFNENFGAFLYGMNMSAFCVDFPEVCIFPHTTHMFTADVHIFRHQYLSPSLDIKIRLRNCRIRHFEIARLVIKKRLF